MGVASEAAFRQTGGEVALKGRPDQHSADNAEMNGLRGTDMSMIFQEPVASLNPLLSVGAQVAESLVVHGTRHPSGARTRAIQMLADVGIPEPGKSGPDSLQPSFRAACASG